jgi:hypothetical protein
MAIAIPPAIGLFSALQEAFRNKTPCGKWVHLTQHTQDFLSDVKWLAVDVASRPTKINDIIPDAQPSTRGAGDVSKQGMGGVHFVTSGNGQVNSLLWRAVWPQKIKDRLVSQDNKTCGVKNSEYELAASVAQFDVLAPCIDILRHAIHNLCDNLSTVVWQRKDAASTNGPIGYLLRLQALHQRQH